MANLALIKGARDAANKFVDVAGFVRQAVLRGEAALLRQDALERAEKEKSEAFRLQLLARGDILQKSKIAPEMQGYATNKAMQLQQQFRQTLLDPNISKEDQVVALQNYNSQIDEITSFNQQFLEFQDNFRKLETSQLSDLNDAERLSNARMIATGQFQWDGENFILGQEENQKVLNAQQLFSEGNQEIIKETVGYNKLLADFQSLGLEQGYKKVPEELFDQMVEQRFRGSDINQMNNAGLASIVVDYISNESIDAQTESDNMEQKQMLKEALKQDYADDGLLNASSTGVKQIVLDSGLPYREYLLNYIKDNVKKATKTQYNIGLNNAPADVIKTKNPTTYELKQVASENEAITRQQKIIAARKKLGFNLSSEGIIIGNVDDYKIPLTDDFILALEDLGLTAQFATTSITASEKKEIMANKKMSDEQKRAALTPDRIGLYVKEQGTSGTSKEFYLNKGASMRNFIKEALKLKGISTQKADELTREILDYNQIGGKTVTLSDGREINVSGVRGPENAVRAAKGLPLLPNKDMPLDTEYFDNSVSQQELEELPIEIQKKLGIIKTISTRRGRKEQRFKIEINRNQVNAAIDEYNKEKGTNIQKI